MIALSFMDARGERHAISGAVGSTVMESAVQAGLDGIDADCGGACSCATCHVYVDADWLLQIGPLAECEDALLDLVSDRRAGSRLSCQLTLTPDLDGLVVTIPESQG